MGIGFLLLDSLAISAVLSALDKFMVVLVPDVKVAWRDVWIVAIITALLFNFGKLLTGMFLGRSSVISAYTLKEGNSI